MIYEIYCPGHINTDVTFLGISKRIHYTCGGCKKKTVYPLKTEHFKKRVSENTPNQSNISNL